MGSSAHRARCLQSDRVRARRWAPTRTRSSSPSGRSSCSSRHPCRRRGRRRRLSPQRPGVRRLLAHVSGPAPAWWARRETSLAAPGAQATCSCRRRCGPRAARRRCRPCRGSYLRPERWGRSRSISAAAASPASTSTGTTAETGKAMAARLTAIRGTSAPAGHSCSAPRHCLWREASSARSSRIKAVCPRRRRRRASRGCP
mmetsp:Transcript_26804/g.77471  ORF Transcript_26804/g.77471 Transcript_26804/m.77471 type:complete len:201 (+) Transcript_26804:490-1092(+)